ncbi:MAG: NIPSNAP family protein [Fimbriiglobus sp.]
MKYGMWTLVLALAVWAGLGSSSAAAKEPGVFELRVYEVNEGKLTELSKAFEETLSKVMVKHGMKTIGFFVPTDAKEQKFYVLLHHKDRDAREASWKAMRADEGFTTTVAAMRKNEVIKKYDEILLETTDYSVPVSMEKPAGERVFELRIYTATPNNLAKLDSRFRDQTRKLFEKYGMTNMWYYHLVKGAPHADDMLYYFLAHKSVEARNKSFDEFRKDAAWIAARDASEKDAGGSLTAKDGVKFVMLKATEYSPLK